VTTYTIHVRCPVCGELHLVSRESYTDRPPIEDEVYCEETREYFEQPDPAQWFVQRRGS
jgi:hypothetical protein